MNKKDFEDYQKGRYQNQIDWYDRKAIQNHNRYKLLQWATLVLSVVTPILIIVETGHSKWIVVAIAALVAISTAALKTFKYQENWINYRTTCETLRKEIHFYNACIQGYEAVEDKEALFVERVESLISRENTLWIVTHEKEENAKCKKS
jgi:hypothetical protein